MLMTAAAFSIALLVSISLTPLVRSLARGRGLLDPPGGRKVHRVAIPRVGGVAMAAAFFIGVALVYAGAALVGKRLPVTTELAAILICGVVIAAVGLIDDLRGMRAMVKLGAQVAIALIAFALGLSIERLSGPWGTLELGWLALPLTLIWVVGLINAINLIDGLDGLAAGVVIIVLTALMLLAPHGAAITLLIAAAAGAAVGFLAYNFHPASIIMGDTGSMFLGFVCAAASIVLTQRVTEPLPAYVPIIALGLPIADTLWAIVRRALMGDSVFEADSRHIHHRLLRGGLSHRDAVLALYAVTVVLGGVAVLIGVR